MLYRLQNWVNDSRYPVIVIGVIALGLRLWAIDFGLPYLYHPDETNKITIAQNIFKTGDLNPHYFSKPTLFIYLNAAAYVPYYFIGKTLGVLGHPQDISVPLELVQAVGRADRSAVILGRGLTTMFGVASVVLVYFGAKRLMLTSGGAAFAALMMAVSPTNVANSRYVTENTFLVFFVLLTFLACLRIYHRGSDWDYALGGIACGLVISSKYNGCMVVVLVLTAHFLRAGLAGFFDRKLGFALVAIPLAFFATTPFALLDYGKFLEDTVYEVHHYWSGHRGMEDRASAWYLSYLWKLEGPVCLLALLGAGFGIRAPGARTIILVSIFPVLYLVFVSSFSVRNDRTLLPALPFIYLLAAAFVDRLVRENPRANGVFRSLLLTAVTAIVVVSVALPSLATVRSAIQLAAIDSRERARRWIVENPAEIPRGSKIAVERYAPFVDPGNFLVEGFDRIIDQPVTWYREKGFDFIVFSEGSFGRFYREPDRYREQIRAYQQFFDALMPLKVFVDDEAVVDVGVKVKGLRLPLPDYSSVGVYEVRVYGLKNHE